MHMPRQNLFTRDDTFFGVCEGLGEDLRIPSNLLRLGLTLGFFFSPLTALGVYAATGMVVLFSRLLVPNPRPAKLAAAAEPAPAPAPEEQAELEPIPLAA